MAGINHVTEEWWWIPGTRGLKRGCPIKDGKIDNKNNKTRKEINSISAGLGTADLIIKAGS